MNIEVVLYNLAGERISHIKASLSAGDGQVVTWDINDVAPGKYVPQIFADNELIETLKVCIQK